MEGHVEASRTAHLPSTCGGKSPGAKEPSGSPNQETQGQRCVCPFEVVATCTSGCAVEGLEVIGPASDAGAAQLCRPEAPVARPLTIAEQADPPICAAEGIACVEGVVRICDHAGQSARLLARCVFGCQTLLATTEDVPSATGLEGRGGNGDVPGAAMNPDGFVSILCMHGHAERR